MKKQTLLLVFALSLFSTSLLFAGKPMRALIVTGQNNHNWKVSSVTLKQQLEASGLFTVDIATSPSAGEDMSTFVIDFSPYKVVILDYNGDHWCDKTRKGFLSYVNKGGGVVVYHAANNAFGDWKEYTEIVALGGWGAYSDKSGPFVHWKNDALVIDNSPGQAGAHGSQSEFKLTKRDNTHPITKGLPASYLGAKDELYFDMRGPANIDKVLFTAYSDPATKGSGREEVLIFTVKHPKARIFHTMIGHAGKSVEDNPAMNSEVFKTTLLRGTQWAATGKVK